MERSTVLLLILAISSGVIPFLTEFSPAVSLSMNLVAVAAAVAAFLTLKKAENPPEKLETMEKDFLGKIKKWKGVLKFDEKSLRKEIRGHEEKNKLRNLSLPTSVKSMSEYDKFLSEQREFETADTAYEKYLKFCSRIGLKCPKKLRKYFEEQIQVGSIKTNADSLFCSILLTPLVFLVLTSPILIFFPTFYKVLAIGLVVASAYVAYSTPSWIATQTKMAVQTDMLYAMLYMSLYLRLNPNLEGAVVFTSEKIGGPFGRDLKKAVWDLHIRKYPNIMRAISQFQEKWAVWNGDFIKSLSVLNASLRETSEKRRIRELGRALDLLLEGTHARMSQFAENLSVQVKLFRGLLLLPILLSLVLPMVSVFMSINPGYLIALFNFILPLVNFTIAMKILAERPGTFKIDVSKHSDLPKPNSFRILGVDIPLLPIALAVFLLVSAFGWSHMLKLTPILLGQSVDPKLISEEYTINNIALSWLITFALGLAIFIYFFGSSVQRIKLRREIRSIEIHFQSTIRELGIALRENIPLESVLRMILDEYKSFKLQNSPMYRLLEQTVNTMNSTGVTFRTALFDPGFGVMKKFPSSLVKNILSILVESINKGPEQAAMVCDSISQYLSKVEELNKDFHKLVVEEVTSMRMESTLLTPLLAAGVSAMTVVLVKSITMIGTTLATLEKTLMSAFNIYQSGSVAESLLSLVDPSKIIPPTILQVIIGAFLVEVTVVYSILQDGIENGPDPVTSGIAVGKGTLTAVIVYTIIMFSVIIFLGSMIQMTAFI